VYAGVERWVYAGVEGGFMFIQVWRGGCVAATGTAIVHRVISRSAENPSQGIDPCTLERLLT